MYSYVEVMSFSTFLLLLKTGKKYSDEKGLYIYYGHKLAVPHAVFTWK